MIKIGERLFDYKLKCEESYQEIKRYLREERIVLVGADDIPLTEAEITEQLQNPDTQFMSKQISGLEAETLSEAIHYIERAQSIIPELIEETDQAVVFQAFTELIESFIYLEKLTSYFSSDILSLEQINSFGERALSQMEKGNGSYLLDIMEYECLPLLLQIKESLLPWKSN